MPELAANLEHVIWSIIVMEAVAVVLTSIACILIIILLNKK